MMFVSEFLFREEMEETEVGTMNEQKVHEGDKKEGEIMMAKEGKSGDAILSTLSLEQRILISGKFSSIHLFFWSSSRISFGLVEICSKLEGFHRHGLYFPQTSKCQLQIRF